MSEAAEMYEKAGMIEKAASIHIASKNFNAAQPLMAQVTSAKLQLQYAKAKESEGRWAEAAAAYEAAGGFGSWVGLGSPDRHYPYPHVQVLCGWGCSSALVCYADSSKSPWYATNSECLCLVDAGDLDAVVRLCLDKLGDKGRACTVTRKSRSTAAAAQVARHCLAAGEPLLLAAPDSLGVFHGPQNNLSSMAMLVLSHLMKGSASELH